MVNLHYSCKYYSSVPIGLDNNGRFGWLKRQLASKGFYVNKNHLHMTIVFANDIPLDKEDRIKAGMPVIPITKLVFDSVEVFGKARNLIVLKASRVPDDWMDYVMKVKGMMLENGCDIEYADSFVPHITLVKGVEEAVATPVVRQINDVMKGMSIGFAKPVWENYAKKA